MKPIYLARFSFYLAIIHSLFSFIQVAEGLDHNRFSGVQGFSQPDGWFVADETNNVRKDCDPDCERDGPRSPDIPHIITPRGYMSVFSDTPIIRWSLVEGAEEYTVTVTGAGVEWELKVPGDTWFVMYDGKQPLKPGKSYLIKVNANNNKPISEAGFFKLPLDKAQAIQSRIEQLDNTQKLELAQLFYDEKLISDAIDVLEKLVNEESKNIEVYCTLSKIYQEESKIYQEERLDDFAKQTEEIAKNLGLGATCN